ncbi:MAG: hypothetical protein J6N52_06660 [Clostridia bacterium]|nr:hypothetical protein [Clostridia bacterium]
MLNFLKEGLHMIGKLLTMSVPKKNILTQENYFTYLNNRKKPQKSILTTKVELLNEDKKDN